MATTPLGKVVIAAAGTPVRITTNLSTPANRVGAQTLLIQVLPGNAGVVYIGQAPTDDRTNLRYTLAILPKPASATTGPFATFSISIPVMPAGLNAADYYIDGTTNDGVLVSLVTS